MNSRHRKLLDRLLTEPKDFTWQEQLRLLGGFGFWQGKGGKTSGSRVRFEHATVKAIHCHRPHPGNIIKPRALRNLILDLEKRGLI